MLTQQRRPQIDFSLPTRSPPARALTCAGVTGQLPAGSEITLTTIYQVLLLALSNTIPLHSIKMLYSF